MCSSALTEQYKVFAVVVESNETMRVHWLQPLRQSCRLIVANKQMTFQCPCALTEHYCFGMDLSNSWAKKKESSASNLIVHLCQRTAVRDQKIPAERTD